MGMKQNENIQVSVVITVYNVQAYLKECLDSVMSQNFQKMEVILVDDGSTDDSGVLCDSYAKAYTNIHVIHQTNRGLSSARNRGIDESRGKWIIFLDSDDVWSDCHCVERLYSYAERHNVYMVKFEYQEVDNELKEINPRRYNKSNILNRVLDNYEFVKYAIAGEWFAVLYLFRKDAIANCRFDEQIKFQEDIDFMCRLLAGRAYRCGYIDNRMYLYRKRESSITMAPRITNLAYSFSLCDVFYKESYNVIDERLKRLYVHYSVMMYYWTLNTVASYTYYKNRKNIINLLNLNELRRRTIVRARETDVSKRCLCFILFHPNVATWLINAKDIIASTLH